MKLKKKKKTDENKKNLVVIISQSWGTEKKFCMEEQLLKQRW